MFIIALLAQLLTFHYACLFRCAWEQRTQTYVIAECGGLFPWLRQVGVWMSDYQPWESCCEYCWDRA